MSKVTPRTLNNKAIGRLGGLKTAEKHGEELAQRRGEKGGLSALRLYGREFYVQIRKQRKSYPKTYRKKGKNSGENRTEE